MSKVIGHFYFKLTGNGNLIGEYSHHGMKGVVVESANSIKRSIGFFGTYDSIWLENGNQKRMELTIDLKNTNSAIYQLKWRDGGVDAYEGEGFIVDGMLIGSYKSV